MRLNTIKPAIGAVKNKKRLGRGIGSGLGKTSGRGHKGQRARAGGFHKLGFEGGQMPLQRRLPKFGFTSLREKTIEINLSVLVEMSADVINMNILRELNVISRKTKSVKIIGANAISKKLTIQADVRTTKGAKAAILAAGGAVES